MSYFVSRFTVGREDATKLGEHVHFDSTGAIFGPRRTANPPMHPAIQSDARRLGHDVMSGFMSLQGGDQLTEIGRLQGVASSVETLAQGAHFIPARHRSALAPFLQMPTGTAFRHVIPGQDELTQSQRTAHYFMGMDAVMPQTPEARAFRESAAVLMSALRLPTSEVSAPVDVGGTTMGVRHPTSPGVPNWPQGGSAHTDADRTRAEHINGAGAAWLQSTHSPTSSVIASALVGAGFTLDSMALPHTARNVASQFAPPLREAQTDHRDVVKRQINVMSRSLGLPEQFASQARDEPVATYAGAPASPFR